MLRFVAHRFAILRPRFAAASAMHLRLLSSGAQKGPPSTNLATTVAPAVAAVATDTTTSTPPRTRGGLLDRLLARLLSERNGRNPLLAAMGYYSRESVAIGAGNSAYNQLRARAESAVQSLSGGGEQPFTLRFEMLSVHVYLTMRRLRREKGSALESDSKTVMQCVFDRFWTDVRNRMLMEEEELTFLSSGKWVKECERMFFGMAVAFDDAWEDKNAFREAIARNITSVRNRNVEGFYHYMWREKNRLDAMPMETFLKEKEVWSPVFKPLGSHRRDL